MGDALPARSSRSGLIAYISEAALLVLALGPTLALGGVHRGVQLAGAALSVVCLALVWIHRRSHGRDLHLPWFGAVLLGLLVFNLLQLIPLPMGLLRLLAPATVQVLEVSLSKAGGVPTSHPISLDPGFTLLEAAKLASFVLAFIAAHNFYYRRQRRHRLALGLVVVGILLTMVGLMGAVVAPGQPLMLYTPDAGRAAGLITTSFVNPNNGSAFLTLCALLAMGLAIDNKDLQRKVLFGLGAVLLGSGVFLTMSRGGILALAVGMGALTILVVSARRRMDLGQAAVVVPATMALIMLMSGWLAYDQIVDEFSDITTGDQGGLAKIQQWSSGAEMVMANPWVGVGRGAFMTSFPRYMKGDIPAGTYEYMENQYLQLPAETGLLVGGGFILSAALAWLVWVRRGRRAGMTMAAGAGLLAIAAHNLVDFSLELPGVALPVALLGGVLSAASLRLRRHSRSSAKDQRSKRRRSRRIQTIICLSAGVVTLVLVAANLISWQPLPRDDDRMLLELGKKQVPLKAYVAAAAQVTRRRPADYMPHLSAAHQAIQVKDPLAITLLNRAIFLFPGSPKNHIQAARALITFGHRRQALFEYRQALEAGALPNPVLRAAIPYCVDTGDLRALLPESADVHARAIKWLRKVENLKLAHWVAERAHKSWAYYLPVCLQRAEVLLALKDKTALTAARICVEQETTLEGYITLARATAALGPKGEEIEVFVEARKHFPESVNMANSLARAHMSHEQFAEAVKVAEEMLRLASRWQDTSRAHKLLGQIHAAMKQDHSAQYHLDQARAIQQQHQIPRAPRK